MARICIVTPAAANARNGNRHTAARWAAMLRSAGHRVSIARRWGEEGRQGERCDLLIALHALYSHDSIRRYREARPRAPLVVALTGTDLYRDLPHSREARRSLELADGVLTLQSEALKSLPPSIRRKASVVHQSSATRLRRAQRSGGSRFRIAVVGHLRKVKDPFRAVLAVSTLADPGIEVVHIGGALEPGYEAQARRWQKREPRYRWLGSLPHARTLGWLAKSQLLVHSSVMEGGANVIVEAARIGVPVLASRMPGNIGMLGSKYPGYYPLYDHAALAALIERVMEKEDFYEDLLFFLDKRRPLFAPAEERRALLGAVRQAVRSQAVIE
jgi:putative glycosyltransferase (TIGR04348 family)